MFLDSTIYSTLNGSMFSPAVPNFFAFKAFVICFIYSRIRLSVHNKKGVHTKIPSLLDQVQSDQARKFPLPITMNQFLQLQTMEIFIFLMSFFLTVWPHCILLSRRD